MDKKKVCLVDVGATGGIGKQWQKIQDYLYPVLFDADPRAEFPDIGIDQKIVKTALYKKSGSITVNLCKKPQVSSIYHPNYEFLKLYTDPNRFEIVEKIELNATTLNNQQKQMNLDRIDFIKLDTQGSELDILKGANEALFNVIGIETEIEFQEMYKGQPLFSDIDNYLRDNGFFLFNLTRKYWSFQGVKNEGINLKGKKKNVLIFGEALYFKLPDIIIQEGSSDKCFRAALCFIVYGYDDHAEYLLKEAKRKEIISKEDLDVLDNLIEKRKKSICELSRRKLRRLITKKNIKADKKETLCN